MTETTFCRTLVEANTGLDGHAVLIDAMKKLLKSEILSECWCFWGEYDQDYTMTKEDYDSLDPEEKRKYHEYYKRDTTGKVVYSYYHAEWQMNVVPGYERIEFSYSPDKSIYHPPAGSGAPATGKINITEGVEDMTMTVVQPDGSSKVRTYQSTTSAAKLVTAGDEDCFVLYATADYRMIDENYVGKKWNYDDKEEDRYYGIAYVDVDEGVTVPWTYENRLGVIRATYTDYGDGSYTNTGYTISNAAPQINGKLPGLDY